MLTGWPALPKPSFINQRFGWLILPNPSFIKPRFGGWTITTTASHNFVKSIQAQHIQVNPIIYQCRNYVDHGTSIKLWDGGMSEEKIPKIWEVGVGQRRRGAMLSVQSKAIN